MNPLFFNLFLYSGRQSGGCICVCHLWFEVKHLCWCVGRVLPEHTRERWVRFPDRDFRYLAPSFLYYQLSVLITCLGNAHKNPKLTVPGGLTIFVDVLEEFELECIITHGDHLFEVLR